MALTLFRTYDESGGTSGALFVQLCSTIELPWRNNARNHSCIPEGRYELLQRHTHRRGDHFLVNSVPGRDGILIHPTNNALIELQGCIAPVTELTGPGKGTQSWAAMELLKAYLAPAFKKGEEVYITIKEE